MIGLFSVSLVMSNALASRIIKTPFTILGISLTLPGGIFLYPVTFLCTDVLGERYGKNVSNECVRIGLICQIAVALVEKIVFLFPTIDPNVNETYKTIFSQGSFFILASLTSYLVSQSCDVYIFHKIRDSFVLKGNYHGQGRWIWNNCSTILSQLLDTIIFSLVGFGIGMGWFCHHDTQLQMIGMIIGQYMCKVILALLDTPIFYILTMGEDNAFDCNHNERTSS